MTGKTLGHYQVTGKLGAGGMGEVYRATDTRLGRDVALKVLPEAFARDPERLARFEREARVLAQLNHPNIAAIYGFEHVDGVPFLVLEYVPGQTLAEMIAAVPLAPETLLQICSEVGYALEEAHSKAVVHRDLKPANIKITPEGKIKVLDFGLAKAFADESAGGDPAQSPTLSVGATRVGTLLGTAAYMSPEQARGQPLDRRTDIWSLGCVLYEMLAGKRAFSGASITDVVAAVVRAEPDWTALPASTPAAMRALLRRCLEKDPRRRLQHIGDARILLEELEEPAPALSPARPAAPWPRRVLPWALALLMAVAAALAWWRATRPQPGPVTRTQVTLSPTDRLVLADAPCLALSPDGTRLVYTARRAGRAQLFLRRMDRFEAAPIAGTEGTEGPFFSPDGEWVGFFAGGKLKKAALSGGAPVALCDAQDSRGAAWGADDVIVFTPSGALGAGLMRVSASGGAPQALTTPDAKQGESGHRWPEILPGGKALLFSVWTGGSFEEARIAVLRLDTGERKTLLEGGTNPRYAAGGSGGGYLIFARAGGLLAAPFDAAQLRLTGPPVPVLSGLITNARTGAAQFTLSATGSLAYVPGSADSGETSLVWVDRKGQVAPLTAAHRTYTNPRLSPDGRRLAVTPLAAGGRHVWVLDLARNTAARLTFEGNTNSSPAWSPDGRRIVFRSNQAGADNLYWKPADGSGPEERLTTSGNNQTNTSFPWTASCWPLRK